MIHGIASTRSVTERCLNKPVAIPCSVKNGDASRNILKPDEKIVQMRAVTSCHVRDNERNLGTHQP